MGSVLGAVGSGIGSVFGSVGGGVIEGAGANDKFQGIDPYGLQYLGQQTQNQQDIYQNQQTLGQALQAQMAGQGPNPAQTQFQANQQSNIANAQGLIASQRGLNPALAARMGSNTAAQQNQQSALGSALLQQQQQQQATANYQNLLQQQQQGNLGYQQNYNNALNNAQGYTAAAQGLNSAQRAQTAGGLIMPLGNFASQGLKGGGGGNTAAAGGTSNAGATTAGGAAGAGEGSTAVSAGALAAQGGRIAGKPAKGPDKTSNDDVPIMAQAGEIIIPNSKAHDPEKAKEFIDHLLKSKEKKGGYGDILAARRKRKAA